MISGEIGGWDRSDPESGERSASFERLDTSGCGNNLGLNETGGSQFQVSELIY